MARKTDCIERVAFSTLILLMLACPKALAQEGTDKTRERNANNLVWKGNRDLERNGYPRAEAAYRKALAEDQSYAKAGYNMGTAQYRNADVEEAYGNFRQAAQTSKDKMERHHAYHNMGNVHMGRKEYEKAVEAYKSALRNDPTDEETRYNLALAKELLEKEKEEDPKGGGNDEQDPKDQKDQKDENQGDQDQDKGDQDNKDQKGGGEQDPKDQGDQDPNGKDQKDKGDPGKPDPKDGKDPKGEGEPKDDEGEQQRRQPRPNKLSDQQKRNILEAIQNEERKVREKVDAKKVKGRKVRNEKDW